MGYDFVAKDEFKKFEESKELDRLPRRDKMKRVLVWLQRQPTFDEARNAVLSYYTHGEPLEIENAMSVTCQ